MSLARHADAVRLSEQIQHRRHDERTARSADTQHHLLTPGSGTHDVAALEILQVIARDAGGAADDGADHDGSDGADFVVLAHQ